MAEYSQKWHNKTSSRTRSTEASDGLVAIQAQLNNLEREIKKVNEKVYATQVGSKRHKENSNIIKEIRASTNAAIRNQGASIKTLEIQIGQMSKVLQERGFGSLPSSTNTNPQDQVKSISTAKADFSEIRRIECFTIIDGDDMTKDVVLGMKFYKKYPSCQMIMKKFALGNKCEELWRMNEKEKKEENVELKDQLKQKCFSGTRSF
ncbi:hypothetical protein Tco_0652401 [Tanacetum coccineum]|uniref:Uncharacterized protein n=1 Tax=Tanacetum coccineum TaxID=301880 RepID=A0ABQ4WXH3_9ASTR